MASHLQSVECALEEEACALKQLWESPSSALEKAQITGNSLNMEEHIDAAEKLATQAKELLERSTVAVEGALSTVGERLDTSFRPVAAHVEQLQVLSEKVAKSGSLELPDSEKSGAEARPLSQESGREANSNYVELVQQLTAEHAAEAGRLRELLAQQEVQRAQEMEELRCYFEKKVADLEKHYSEEITSQHSRRISGSSCESDSEFAADMHFGSGDAAPRIPPLTHICETCSSDPGYKELEEKWKVELEKRLQENRDQLACAHRELKLSYENEIENLKNQYEKKLEQLAADFVSKQQSGEQAAVQEVTAKLQNYLSRKLHAVRDHLLVLVDEESTEAVGAEEEVPQMEGLEELHGALQQVEVACQKVLEKEAETAMELLSSNSVDVALNKVKLEEQLRREVRLELEKEVEKKVEEMAEAMKTSGKLEHEKFVEAQTEMLKEFVEQHQKDLIALKEHHQLELENALQQRHSNLHKEVQTLGSEDNKVPPLIEMFCHKEVQTCSPDVSTASHAVQTSPVRTLKDPSFGSVTSLPSPDVLRARPVDASSMVFESSSQIEAAPERTTFMRILQEVEAAYLKDLRSLLAEWVQGLERVGAGTQAEGDAQSMQQEYILDLCNKFKCLLSDLEAAHKTEIVKLMEQPQVSTEPENQAGLCLR